MDQATTPNEFQNLQQEYAKLAQIYGDICYRIQCFKGDATTIENQMKTVNQKAAEFAQKQQEIVKEEKINEEIQNNG